MAAYIVFRQDADSYHSRPELPIAVFTDASNEVALEKATKFAKAQTGYGLNIDWFVGTVEHNPEAG